MGAGSFSESVYASYSTSLGRSYDTDTGRVIGQTYKTVKIDKALNPKKFKVRECVNTEEHPNTVPVILALDVTGSMGEACSEVAAALGTIMTSLYEKFTDIEFCIMGIGDLAYDEAPIQMSQFESDIRIAEALDKVYMEHGGGGNTFESYTAAWYMGLHRTKLDCYDKQKRKGIIITIGDEPLNPYLPAVELNSAVNATEQYDVETKGLYAHASQKFDIYHIAVDSPKDTYSYYAERIKQTFGEILGDKFKVSDIQNLAKTIEECIAESVQEIASIPSVNSVNENGEISW